MSLYLFDTDTLTLFQRMHPAVVRNVFYHLADDIRVTSVTVEEQLSGWFTTLRAARTPQQVETAHIKLNVGGSDLRIAAIALDAAAIVVTRNLRDFRRIPGVQCEDWSV